MTYAETRPTLDSDINAFKHSHPCDFYAERTVFDNDVGKLVEALGVFEIFSFTAPEVGDITFDVRGIKGALADGTLKFQMFESELDKEQVEHIRSHNGVETKRMAELTAADLERPAIIVMWPDGHSTVIDGNNRIVRRWDDGLKTFRFAGVSISRELLPYICRPGEEEKFLARDDAKRGAVRIGKAKMVIR